MTTTAEITKRSTMQEVLEAYPSAQRALFRRYHIGGCNSCGYQPEAILEEVAHGHNITDLDKVIAFIQKADEIDRRIQVSPREVAEAFGAAPRRVWSMSERERSGTWPTSRAPRSSARSSRRR